MGCRKGGMQEKEGCRIGEVQERWDAGEEECRILHFTSKKLY